MPYVPRADELASVWMQSFARNIALDPGRYALAPADAAHISLVVEQFVAALAVSSAPGTRTLPKINTKTELRAVAEQVCRHHAMLIKVNQDIDDADKIAVGVRPLNRNRTRIKAPQTSPRVNIIGNTPGGQTLTYRDSVFPARRAKPFGAHALELWLAVAPDAVFRIDGARYVGAFKRSPIFVPFTVADDKKTATYWGRWVSNRGDTGPWSLPVSFTIAAAA